jgi:pimeloyl-ACP methyl ester carboxylesterase
VAAPNRRWGTCAFWRIAYVTSLLVGVNANAQLQKAPPLKSRGVVVATGETLAVFSNLRSASAAVTDSTSNVVVFLPSPIGSAFGMRHLTTALADSGTAVIVVDLLGMGESARPVGVNYSLARQASRLETIFDSLGLRGAVLVAHGISASVALRFAAAYPARAAGIVSISGGPVDAQKTSGVGTAMTFSRLLDNPLGRALGRRKFQGAMREQSATDTWYRGDVLREYLKPYEKNLRGSLRALQQMSEATEPTPIATLLPGVRVPVRLLVGDKIAPSTPTREQIALMQERLPQFKVDTVARSGTLIHEERPDAVLVVIRQLLARVTIP